MIFLSLHLLKEQERGKGEGDEEKETAKEETCPSSVMCFLFISQVFQFYFW